MSSILVKTNLSLADQSRRTIRVYFLSLPDNLPGPIYRYSTSSFLRNRLEFIMVSPAIKRKSEHTSGPDQKKPKGGSITAFFGAPKPKPSSTQSIPTPASRPNNFDKQKWVASLTPEQKELLQLEIDTLDESWLAHLKDELVSMDFLNLKRFLKKEKDSKVKVFPPEEDIYSW
jgi:uracil-DNA glycosylase